MNHSFSATCPARARLVGLAVTGAVIVLAACRREPDAPTQVVYQNGYPQTQQQAYAGQVTYQNGYPQQTYAPPAGYQQPGYPPQSAAQPPPAAAAAAPTTAAPQSPAPAAATTAAVAAPPAPSVPPTGTMIGAAPPPAPTMAVPGIGALPCQSDANCILGRCNTQYGRCAYPCKSSAMDCAPNAVCGPLGLCVPNLQGAQTPH